MTEIVADKTVEVVKNAIETADGALDLPGFFAAFSSGWVGRKP